MKISFIVPVYKVEEYIVKCLSSIQQQSLADFECLVVDDGSPDRSIEIAKKEFEKDSRFIFLQKENGGLSEARNFGLQQAKGEYVCFVDSDDYIHQDLAKDCCAIADQENCQIVCFDLQYVYPDGHEDIPTSGGDKRLTSFVENKEILLWNNSANNKVYRRSFLHDKEFIVGIWYEDLAVIPVWMSQAQQIAYLNKAYYYYLQREGSISHSADPRVFDIYFSLRNLKENIPDMPEEIFTKLVLEDGLIMTNIRIKEMNNRKQRLSFYERHAKELMEVDSSWFKKAMKANYSWKQKLIFSLFKLEAFSVLDKVSKR